MYIVRNKKTKEILWKNPAPLKQDLKGKDVWYQFDATKHEIGKIEGPVPQHFNIVKGNIVEWSLQKKVSEGVIVLTNTQMVSGEMIIPKPQSQLLHEGIIKQSDLDAARKIELKNLIITTQINIDAGTKNGLDMTEEQTQLSAYKKEYKDLK